MNDVVKNENFKASEILNIFLSVNDRTLFETQMKNISPKSLLMIGLYSKLK